MAITVVAPSVMMAQVDIWNEYQATRLKLHMQEIARYAKESSGLKAQAWRLPMFSWGATGVSLPFTIAGVAERPIHPDRLIAFLT